MSQFEVITLSLSFVLGLSMSHLLWAAAAAVRARHDLRLHWLPFAWAACIFFLHLQYWFAAFSIDRVIETWTWSWYLQILGLGILLFASGAFILPSESQQRSGDLLDDFNTHGRLALIPLALYFAMWIPMSYRLDAATLDAGNIANFTLAVLVGIGFVAKGPVARSGAPLAVGAMVVWASIFVWGGGSL